MQVCRYVSVKPMPASTVLPKAVLRASMLTYECEAHERTCECEAHACNDGAAGRPACVGISV